MKRFCLLFAAFLAWVVPSHAQPSTPASPPPAAAQSPAAAAGWSDLTNQLRAAWDQLRAAEADKALLQAKLREALAAQPAAIDPRELARADEKIRALQKDNDLLRLALNQANAVPATNSVNAPELERLRRALAEAQRKLKLQTEAAVLLLAETNTKLDQQSRLASSLAQERDDLQRRLELAATSAKDAVRRAGEEANLRKPLADAKASGTSTANIAELNRQLTQTQNRLATVQTDRDTLAQEKKSLERRLDQAMQQVSKANQAAAAKATDARRIRDLERDRDRLQKELADANKEMAGRKSKSASRKLAILNDEMVAMRARLDAYEAKAVPYTREELALFQKPEPRLVEANAKAARRAARKAPAAAVLVAAGDHQFKSGEFDKAEASYQEAALKNDKDLRTLCNLATTEAAQNQLPKAEATIRKALAIDPNDASSLGVLGYVKYAQGQYDAALEAVGRATKSKPQDAGLQNLLGMALVEKGMRGQAETAFRKALQINPNFPDAHRNLASIYLTQKPPLKELARWHYQRALAAGHPHVPEIEKQLEDTKPDAGGGN